MDTAENDDVPVDDAAAEADGAAEAPRVPEDGERAALQELEACLHDGGGDSDGHDKVEEVAPGAGLREAKEKECDGKLPERDGPVPEDLGDEEVAH